MKANEESGVNAIMKQDMMDTKSRVAMDGAGAAELAGGLTADRGAEILSLEAYEARIRLYKEQAVSGFIGIGRTLNEAKAAGVVPHGQWEAWVEKTTGMGIRQAQRCMQAAVEIRDGSWLGRLDMGKAMMLLSSGLEDGQREALARRAAGGDAEADGEGSSAKGMTERELRAEIRRLQGKLDTVTADADKAIAEAERRRREAGADVEETVKALKLQIVKESGAAAEIRAALKKAEAERDQMAGQLRARDEAWRGRLEEETGSAYRRGSDEGRLAAEKELAAEVRKEFQGKLDFANSKVRDREERLRTAEADLRQAQIDASKLWDEGYRQGASQAELSEQQLRNEKAAAETALATARAELAAAEEREARKARELAELKRERTQARMDSARGIRIDDGGLDLTAAVRQFIGAAGALPQMGQLLAGLTESERESLRAQVETVARWVRDARAALGTVAAEASIR